MRGTFFSRRENDATLRLQLSLVAEARCNRVAACPQHLGAERRIGGGSLRSLGSDLRTVLGVEDVAERVSNYAA